MNIEQKPFSHFIMKIPALHFTDIITNSQIVSHKENLQSKKTFLKTAPWTYWKNK